MVIKSSIRGSGVYSGVSKQEPMIGSSERSNGLAGSRKGSGFIEYPSDCYSVKQGPVFCL